MRLMLNMIFVFVTLDIDLLSIAKLHPPLKSYFKIFAVPFLNRMYIQPK